ncbi:MAG: DUF357 domain-containing protein [Candidatus Aenigmarchaeota archaeon]|nr:DUF357 domain-containing protein [Candidatus Aenigmarchaeota archaeon]
MNAVETYKELIEQTGVWLDKAENIEIFAHDPKGEEFKENIEAYITDTGHFIHKGDFVRAFEAIVWAWAWIEIGSDTGIISVKDINKKE